MLSISIPVVVGQVRTKAGRFFADLSFNGGEFNMEVSHDQAKKLPEGGTCMCVFEVRPLIIVQYSRPKTVLNAVRLLDVKAGQGDG